MLYKNKRTGKVDKEIHRFNLRGETVILLSGESGMNLAYEDDLRDQYETVDTPKIGSLWVMSGNVHYVYAIIENKSTGVVIVQSQTISYSRDCSLEQFMEAAVPLAVEEGQKWRPAELCKRTGPWGTVTEVGTLIEIQIDGGLKSVSKRDLARFWMPSPSITKQIP